MHHSIVHLDETDEASSRVTSEYLRSHLRPIISTWIAEHPGRSFLQVPLKSLHVSHENDTSVVFRALRGLEDYVGAALKDAGHLTPIPWGYRLFPTLSGVEVIVMTDDFVARPAHELASEVAHLVQSSASSIPVDEVFSFRLPVSILELRAELDEATRALFRSELNKYLLEKYLEIESGTVDSTLQIRRNR